MCLSRSRVKTFYLQKKNIQNVTFGIGTSYRHLIDVEMTSCVYRVLSFE